MLNFVIETAHEAGNILLEKFGRKINVSKKSEVELITEADLVSEKFILDRIKKHYPKHSILAEESGEETRIGDSRWKWIIDPLDGTTNYAHGYPCFCVTIAVEHEGKIVIGASYDPTREEMFSAEKGGGARLNSKPISVSEINKLSDSLLVTGFPYDVSKRDNFAGDFTNMLLKSCALRRDGSAALNLAYVACGRFDGFWEEGLEPWDMAAGVLLVEEAGGKVSCYDGSNFSIYEPPICASNGFIHDEMLGVLA